MADGEYDDDRFDGIDHADVKATMPARARKRVATPGRVIVPCQCFL
jgi:hypothetical protein